MFQFHAGLIKSIPKYIEAIDVQEFQFHAGLIKSQSP